MRNAEIKSRVLTDLKNNKDTYAGFKYGDVKKMIIQNYGDEGFVGIFYKNCIGFENYKGKYDTRPIEIFSFSIDIEEDEDEDGNVIETIHFYFDLHFDCDTKDDEWQEKRQERMSDREFFDYWT